MLKRKIITFCVAFVFCTVIIIMTSEKRIDNNIGNETETTKAAEYIIKDYCGKIAVFKSDEEIPEKVYDIYTDTLPGQDVVMIRHGITAKNRTELNKLISDYTS